jgi:Rieske [2Fe-2S] domain/Ring hydroxylating beta subunit
MSARSYIVDDHEKKTFLLDREVLVSEDVLRTEMARIFGRCWVYVGHGSELKKPGDFRSRKVAGRPVIFCRDQAGNFHCLFNTCRHRGAMVCTNFVCYRYRRYERIREYVGAYRYILERRSDSFRIKERRVLIDAHELGSLGSVSFIL